MNTADGALGEKLGDDLLLCRRIVKKLSAAKTVLCVVEQLVQRDDDVGPGHVGRDMVRVRDADIGCGIGCNVGDDIIIDATVVGIEAHIHGDIRVQRLKVRNGLLVNRGLDFVGVVLRPEGDVIMLRAVEALGDREGSALA